MRIISGKHKGRKIELGKEAAETVRPTSDFAREAIFNILIHGQYGKNGQAFIAKDVLDVFCGTGAFGLEALSRGAASVTFIDQSRDAINNARLNATKMHEIETCDFLLADATKLGGAKKTYALAFLDPPYFGKMIEPSLTSLYNGNWIDADSLIIVEHDAKEQVLIPEIFTVFDERRYGRATVKFVKLA